MKKVMFRVEVAVQPVNSLVSDFYEEFELVDSAISRARMLSLFGHAQVLDTHGDVVYSAVYRELEGECDCGQ